MRLLEFQHRLIDHKILGLKTTTLLQKCVYHMRPSISAPFQGRRLKVS